MPSHRILAAFLLLPALAWAVPPPAGVKLNAPNGGEVWLIGSSRNVKWIPYSGASTVDIEYTKDGGSTWSPLAMGTSNDGVEAVTVPDDPSATVRVRVTETPEGTSDMSDADLSIAYPPINLLSPNGGQNWVVGSAQTITWTPGTPSSPVNIEYTTDGSTFFPLVTGTANDGSQGITVPGVLSASVRVRITETDSGSTDISGFNNKWYGIIVATPNGGETWTADAAQTVTWSSLDAGPGVAIDYSTDGGSSWSPLALSANDGTESVSAPQAVSTTVRIRVRGTATSLSDMSDANFKIVASWKSITLSPGLTHAAVAWGDYDSNTKLDLAVCGDDAGTPVTRIYRNTSGDLFSDIGAGIIGVSDGALAWGDYDLDGDLDLAVAGLNGESRVARIYRNDGSGVFVDIGASLTGVDECALAWADFDKDGDLDLAISGSTGVGLSRSSRIYRNDGAGTFTDIGAAITDVLGSALAWGDFDGDGDVDLALAGSASAALSVTRIFRNDGGGSFTDIGPGLPGVAHGSLAWGDYDGDGDLDLALMGTRQDGVTIARIFRNDGSGVFTDSGAHLARAAYGSIAWGDFDNDGDLDLALCGADLDGTGEQVATIYRNDGGTFVDTLAPFTAVTRGGLALGDYNNDGNLDVAIAGQSEGGLVRVYKHTTVVTNLPPAAPSSASSSVGLDSVTLSWGAPSDDHTPAAALSYNLRVGPLPGPGELFAIMAAPAIGVRRVPRLGAIQGTSITLNLPPGKYQWRVQAIDGEFRGGAWTTTGTFTISGEGEE